MNNIEKYLLPIDREVTCRNGFVGKVTNITCKTGLVFLSSVYWNSQENNYYTGHGETIYSYRLVKIKDIIKYN